MDGVWALISLGLHVGWGFWTASVAQNKGYNPVLAGILGFLFGLIPMLVYYMLPDRSLSEGDIRPSRNVSGTEAKRQQFAQLEPGTCRVCGYANAPRDPRCYQCGNMM